MLLYPIPFTPRFTDMLSVETNNEILGISNSEESLGAPDDGTFKTLQEKINNTAEGDTLVLENDYANCTEERYKELISVRVSLYA